MATDEDTKDVKKEIDRMIQEGKPLYKDGKRYYGDDARRELEGFTLVGALRSAARVGAARRSERR